MIEWINKIFGVTNEVSVPTLISIIVFIIGGLVNYFFVKIKDYNSRKANRETFRHLVNEVIKDLKIKERNISKFYPDISIETEKPWVFEHRHIIYLEIIFEFNFSEVYYSFRKKFSLSTNKELKSKAFHRIWSLLRKYKFYENRIFEDLDNLIKSSNEEFEQYNYYLEKYRELKEQEQHRFRKEPISDNKTKIFLKKEDEIWFSWEDLGEIRTHHFYSYNHFVLPILELHRTYSHLSITLECAQVLVKCQSKYYEMENIIDYYNSIFKDYYLGYRRDHKLLKKYLELI